MPDQGFSVIILAAGQGTRMKSPLPKVLHPVAGTPMILRVVNACREAGAEEIRAVVGYGEKLVRDMLEPQGVQCFRQEKQLGTADAVKAAEPQSMRGNILIMNGDHPLVSVEDIKNAVQEFKQSKSDLAVFTCSLKNPGEFGRIVRQGDSIRAIVEIKDAAAETLKINEVNTGVYLSRSDFLQTFLPRIENFNTKQEFYLTDLVGLGVENNKKVIPLKAHKRLAFGVNNQSQLARATRICFRRKANRLMEEGVVLVDPNRVYIEDEVIIGQASVIYPGVYLRGKTAIGKFTVVESNCQIHDSIVGDSCQVRASSYLETTVMHSKSIVGPFARLRPGAVIGEEARIGNFVEVKKAVVGARSKANHLAYIGDAEIGHDTNFGCGAITVNYAVNKKKYMTRIGNNVFIGSDCNLVAPVEIKSNSFVAAGSTITKDVPEGALAVARGRQVVKENYKPKDPVRLSENEQSGDN